MATWSSSYITNLPDSAFACINDAGRHYPHHDASGAVDAPHLRAAMSRIGDPANEQCGKAHLMAHEKSMNMGKSLLPVKAQPMDDDELAAWFSGRVPRRLLAIPFGGPILNGKAPKGVDLDGEYFSDRTDLYGAVKGLRDTRERLLDWHHGADQLMRREVIGKTILDPNPDEDGWWVDAWLNAGKKHLDMVRRLVDRGAQLFGSSEAAYKKTAPDGEILVWPMLLETLTTQPTNTLSVLRPYKAADLLDSVDPVLRAVLADLDNLGDDLAPTSRGDVLAKAGRDLNLDPTLEPWEFLRRRK